MAGAVLDAWQRIGATVIPVGSGNTDRLVKAFQRLGAEALGCTPSYAIYLADWCREREIDPRELGVRVFSVAGEPGGGEDATRHAIEDAFGATVREAMGIADVSPSLWGECEEQAGMHFCGDPYIYPELIDAETDEPLPFEDGAEGELVYTTLIREAMPVLRFRSRDRVVVNAKPCPCGRGALRVRCIGRVDDLLIVRGVNLLPDRGARGRRRVPPARRRPGADPPRAHRRAPGRRAARARRARRGGRAPTTSSRARSARRSAPGSWSPPRSSSSPTARSAAASTRASWWTSPSPLRGDAEQRRVAVGALDDVVR